MDLQTLTDNFAIPGVLEFAQTATGLIRGKITTPACSAELYLHGAHLTQWQPTGRSPVLYLSDQSAFEPDKPIRGGIPVIFPWFGPRKASTGDPRTDGPAHGFARIAEWQLAFAAIMGDDLHLTLTLGPNDTSRALGFDTFQLAYSLTLGRELHLRLTVANQSGVPLHFEEALHTYFTVGDAGQITLTGLAATDYLDKTDNFHRKRQTESVLTLTAETDRPYLNTDATVSLDDPVLHRRITIAKSNSETTVVWNPWSELSARLADLGPGAWKHMVCVETANAIENAITLAPQQTHTMSAWIKVEDLPH